MSSPDAIQSIVSYLRARVPMLSEPLDAAIVCGSGLSGLSRSITGAVSVPYADIPGFPMATVAGHGTELVFGLLGGARVVAQRGRFHAYEGNTAAAVTLPVRTFAALGAKVMVATNAAGGLNAAFHVGDIMIIRDHVSFACAAGAQHPLVGPNDARFGPRFPPLNGAYPDALAALATGVAGEMELGSALREGVYFHVSGPSYETPSEIAAFRKLGGDAVGMSTVPEVIAAAHAGMSVLGLSLITNQCR
jgi:purine-nucleoside phosphorylase